MKIPTSRYLSGPVKTLNTILGVFSYPESHNTTTQIASPHYYQQIGSETTCSLRFYYQKELLTYRLWGTTIFSNLTLDHTVTVTNQLRNE